MSVALSSVVSTTQSNSVKYLSANCFLLSVLGFIRLSCIRWVSYCPNVSMTVGMVYLGL